MVCMLAVQAVTLPFQRLLKACLRFFASRVLPLKLKASVCTSVLQILPRAGAGHSEELTGQNMTNFTARLWRALREYAPRDFRYDFDFDRNRKPSGSATDASTTQARPHGLFISVPAPLHSHALSVAELTQQWGFRWSSSEYSQQELQSALLPDAS